MRITRYRLDIEKKWKQIDRKMTHKTNSGWKKLVKAWSLGMERCFWTMYSSNKSMRITRPPAPPHKPHPTGTQRHRQTKQRETKDQNELRWGQYSQCIHTFMCIKEDILTDNRGQEGDKPSLTDTYTDSSAHNRRTNIHTQLHTQAMRKRARNIIAHMHTYVHTHRDTQTRRASLAVSSSAPSWLNVVSHIN